jgi:hypothetical protein
MFLRPLRGLGRDWTIFNTPGLRLGLPSFARFAGLQIVLVGSLMFDGPGQPGLECETAKRG